MTVETSYSFERNSIVKGTVTEVDARSATVNLGEGILGTLRASEMARGMSGK